eukprot:s1267_g19.t1
MARRQRWADMADSSSSDAAPAPPAPRGGPPFWLILRVYLAGLFRPNVAWSSVARLQRLLGRPTVLAHFTGLFGRALSAQCGLEQRCKAAAIAAARPQGRAAASWVA